MSDDTDLEIKFGADASGVEASADEVKASIESISTTMEALTAAMTAQTEAITEGFKQMAEASAETRAEMERDFEEEEAGILRLVGSVHEGVESINELRESVVGFGELILAAFAVEAIVEFVEKMGEAGEKTEHTAEAFGLSIAETQRLQAVFTAAGAGPDALGSAMARLDRSASNAVSGQQKASDAFKMLGVDLSVARTPAELMEATLQGFGNIEGPNKAAVAMAIFGRNVQTIAPLLGLSKDSLDAFNASADKFGDVMPEATEKAAALGAALNLNKDAMAGVDNILADALAPSLTEIVQDLNNFIASLVENYKQGGLVKEILETLATTITALQVIFEEVGEIATTALGLMVTNSDEAHTSMDGLRGVIVNVASALIACGVIVQEVGLFFIQLGNDLDIVNLRAQQAGASVHDFFTGGNNAAKFDGQIEAVNQRIADTSTRMKTVVSDAQAMYEKMLAMPKEAGSDGEAPVAGTPPKLGGKDKKDTGAEDALQKARELFEEQEAAHRGMIDDMTADELAFWTKYAQSAEYASLTDKQQATVRLNIAKLERQEDLEQINAGIADKKDAAAQAIAAIQSELSASEAATKQKIATIQAGEKEGVVSRTQGTKEILALIQSELIAATSAADQILMQRVSVDEYIKSVSATTTDAYKAAQKDEVAANAQRNAAVQSATNSANTAMVAATNQAAEAQAAATRKMYTSIGDYARTTTEGLIEGNMTWQQAFTKGLEGMLDLFLSFIEKQVVSWAAAETTKTGATVTGNASRIVADTAGAAQSIAIGATSAIARVAQEAAVAAAGAYAALAAVPFIGPILAPAAAATALAAVIALGSTIFSASGGFDIPSGTNPMTQLHAQEMVLPANIAVPLRSAVKSWGASGSPTASSLVDSATQNGGNSGGIGSGRASKQDLGKSTLAQMADMHRSSSRTVQRTIQRAAGRKA